ncbi:DUF4817 domain-containing protein [Nephila pilipes]|uniref:DUF4817 domain-containing protein n=1 Tax=Nephila pilipes TaxID=299642 RepID=A0A8X6NN83_NEPPI|nr:DUF4817 domain-containing protein [Nephila pilipes]
MQWRSEERTFAVATYFSNLNSIIASQRAFRKKFKIAPKGPDLKSIVQQVDTFMNTGIKKNPGSSKTTMTPEDVERVRKAVLKSPKRSASKHATSLPLSSYSETNSS